MAKKMHQGCPLEPVSALAMHGKARAGIPFSLILTPDAHKSARRTVCNQDTKHYLRKAKYIPRPKTAKLWFWIKQKNPKAIGSCPTKRIDIFIGRDRQTLPICYRKPWVVVFGPRQSFIHTMFSSAPCYAQRGQQWVPRAEPLASFLRNSLGSAKELHK